VKTFTGIDRLNKKRFIIVGAAALAVIISIVAWSVIKYSKPPDVSGFRPSTIPADVRSETSLRNVTDYPIKYTVRYLAGKGPDLKRTLKPDGLDKFPPGIRLLLTYDNGERTIVQYLDPGKPYCFRFDGNGIIQIYPGSHSREDAPDLAPFIPTPKAVIDRMLEMASVGPNDILYDVGCGDGRIVIAAAKERGARSVGIDIDAALIETARKNAAAAGVGDRVRFICQDAVQADFSEATVLAVYLLPESLDLLRPKFEEELKPGTRIVTHDYEIPGWEDKKVLSDAIDEPGIHVHWIYLYRR
jgi:hypothetical protein